MITWIYAGTPAAHSTSMPSDNDLQRWIAASRQNRQHLKVGLAVFTGLAFLVSLSSHRIGFVMFFIAATVAVSGFWILAGHIADWEGQLARRRVTTHARLRPDVFSTDAAGGRPRCQ